MLTAPGQLSLQQWSILQGSVLQGSVLQWSVLQWSVLQGSVLQGSLLQGSVLQYTPVCSCAVYRVYSGPALSHSCVNTPGRSVSRLDTSNDRT